jgi:hypothetical protein
MDAEKVCSDGLSDSLHLVPTISFSTNHSVGSKSEDGLKQESFAFHRALVVYFDPDRQKTANHSSIEAEIK